MKLFSALIVFTFSAMAYGQSCSGVFALSGGGSKDSNYLRYYDNLDRITDVFGNCPRKYSLANGNNTQKIITDRFAEDPADKFVGRKVKDQSADGYGAAHENYIENELPNWTPMTSSSSKPVIFYVTDHGGKNKKKGLETPGSSSVTLYRKPRPKDPTKEEKTKYYDDASLSTEELNRMFKNKPSNKPVILLMDQCYGGGMMHSLFNDPNNYKSKINGCGIAAAQEDQVAWLGGGVLRNMQEMVKENGQGNSNYEKLFERMENESIEREEDLNQTIRSLPVKSSEFYAKRYLVLDTDLVEPLNICRDLKYQISSFESMANGFITNSYGNQIIKEMNKINERVKSLAKTCGGTNQTIASINDKDKEFRGLYKRTKTFQKSCMSVKSKYIVGLAKLRMKEIYIKDQIEKKLPALQKEIEQKIQKNKLLLKNATPARLNSKNEAQLRKFAKAIKSKDNRDKYNKNKEKFFTKYMKAKFGVDIKQSETEIKKISKYFDIKKRTAKNIQEYQQHKKFLSYEGYKVFKKLKSANKLTGINQRIYTNYFGKIETNSHTKNDYALLLNERRKKNAERSYDKDLIVKLNNNFIAVQNQIKNEKMPILKSLSPTGYKELKKHTKSALKSSNTILKAKHNDWWKKKYNEIKKDDSKLTDETLKLFKCLMIGKSVDQKKYNGCLLIKNKLITLQALERMLKTKNNTAMKAYLNTVNCERSAF